MEETEAPSPLKTALTAAGLTTEQFAEIVGVDVKTVRRWIHGRVPYPRHRIAISRALDLTQHQLWPELPASATTDPADQPPESDSADADTVAGYASPDHPAIPPLADLITAATDRIDIGDDSLHPPPAGEDPRLYFPSTQLGDPGLLSLLIAKAREGVQVRVLLSRLDPDLADLPDIPTLELRSGTCGHTIHRADDQLLLGITGIVYGNELRPVLHVTRQVSGGLFDRLLDRYQTDWRDAELIESPETLAELLADAELDRERVREELEDHADAEVSDESEESEESEPEPGPPPRRWPGRPQ